MSATEDEVMERSVDFASTRLRHLLNSTPSVIYSTKARGDFACTFVNDNVQSVLGYAKSEMLTNSKFWVTHIHPEDKDRVLEAFETQVANGGGVLEYRFRCKDGRFLWIHDSHRLINDDEGEAFEVVGSWTDITQRYTLSQQLSYEATHDALTGLVNRREFEKRLETFLNSTRTLGHCGALCYLDLDQFKVINDSLGHVAGDQLLRELGAILSTMTRERDTLARLGGDEFALILQHCDLAKAQAISNAVCKEIEAYRFLWDGERHRVGASIGVTRIDKNAGNSTDLLKQADSACYMAKELGRGRVYTYKDNDGDVEQRRTEMRLVSSINQAIEENRFVLYAQPIVPVNGEDAVSQHYEVLLRMLGADGEVIGPGTFLGSAQRYGLSTRIDRWVVGSTLAWLAANTAHTDQLSLCSINLSGHTLGDVDTISFIEEAIVRSGIAAEKLCFEITETAAVSNLAAAIRLIVRLRDIGCSFALDDFGTGFSSFSYLGRLPVDYLKIDGEFIKDICTNPIHHVFVRAINDVGHVMKLQTIAEFVENDDITAALEEIGVDFVQGYGVGKPRAIDEMLFVA